MDSFLLAYIAQRMREMGFKDYTFEPVRVQSGQVDATNEYYYLVAKIVSDTLVIRSDAKVFEEAADYSNFNYYGMQEFTGVITLEDTVNAIDYEFVRVIPRTSLEPEKQLVVDNFLKTFFNDLKKLITKK